MKSAEGRRRRLSLLELAQGLIMPQVRRRSLIPIVQVLIRLAMNMVLQLLVSHLRLNRQWVLSRGEYVACDLVKLTRKLGWKVGHAENLYVSITATSCVGTIPIHPGSIFTNIIADSDFTYKLRFLTLQIRLCGSSCMVHRSTISTIVSRRNL